MPNATTSTHQKALTINLDDKIYGTIAEIGAAQEVARWFFQVGAAAGSGAKTLSAYDKQISDDIYGEAGRYVSRERLEAMLHREYQLLVERLSETRGHDTRFFAFCNTVSARNYAGTNECQGWVGIRFQSEVGGAPNTVILHINMLDDTNLAQQEVVGILGVNLIYAVFFQADGSGHGLATLGDNTGTARLEADLVDATGPAFEGVDAISTGMAIVQGGLAQAILLDHTGRQQPPTEIIHKRPAIIERTTLRNGSPARSTSLQRGAQQLAAEGLAQDKAPVRITEFSIDNVHTGEDSDTKRVLAHLRQLVDSNEWVMLTAMGPTYRLSSYLRRYSQQPVRYVVGISTLVMLLCDKFYGNSGSSMLEATGKLFSQDARIYVQTMSRDEFELHIAAAGLSSGWFVVAGDNENVSLGNLSFLGPVQKLYEYLLESDWIEALQPGA